MPDQKNCRSTTGIAVDIDCLRARLRELEREYEDAKLFERNEQLACLLESLVPLLRGESKVSVKDAGTDTSRGNGESLFYNAYDLGFPDGTKIRIGIPYIRPSKP